RAAREPIAGAVYAGRRDPCVLGGTLRADMGRHGSRHSHDERERGHPAALDWHSGIRNSYSSVAQEAREDPRADEREDEGVLFWRRRVQSLLPRRGAGGLQQPSLLARSLPLADDRHRRRGVCSLTPAQNLWTSGPRGRVAAVSLALYRL